MNLKGVSFSKYKVLVDIYTFEKLSLFAFLFTKIVLNDTLDKSLKVVDCLHALDIKEDMLYLFNNVYYEFIDNKIIEEVKEDIYDLKLNDIHISERFVKYLNDGYMPILNDTVNKEFIYDCLKKKIVVSDLKYDESNIVLVKTNNDFKYIENLINDNKEGLFDIKDGECILKDAVIDPYYFEISLKEKDNKYHCEYDINNDLKSNSLFINNTELKGDILTNNIYFKCVYGNELLKDYSEYVFVNDKEKEYEVKGNVIYVNFNMDEGDFIDLVNLRVYKCGEYELGNEDKVSTYVNEKAKRVSEFKLYLNKNKDRFKVNIKQVIDLL